MYSPPPRQSYRAPVLNSALCLRCRLASILQGAAAMVRRSEVAIWGGVMAGLDNVQTSDTPLLALGQFLGQLRRMGWHPADIRAVERNILEVLSWSPDGKSVAGPNSCLVAG
jgi:hypothetical protein